MATRVTIHLRGEATRDGTIELVRFAKFTSDFQTVVNRIEYALRKDNNRSPGFNPKIQKGSLRLAATGKGNSYEVDIEVAEPEQRTFETNMSDQALQYFVVGLDSLRDDTDISLPYGYDQGVLVSIREMGTIFRHKIDQITMDMDAPNGQREVVYDPPLLARINGLISEHEERIDAIEGRLLQVNFKEDVEDRYKCRLYKIDGSYTTCTFDDDVADDIQAFLRNYVSAIGIATVDPLTDTISNLHIKKLVVFGDDTIASEREAIRELEAYRAENDTLTHLSYGLQEAMRGETRPISDLWASLNDE